jgi:hypothetical protein
MIALGSCASQNIKPHFDLYGRSLAIVIQTTLEASYDLQLIQQNVQSLVDSVGLPAAIARWVLIKFDGNC